MKAVVLDGFTLNPGDLNWDALFELANIDVYDRTPALETARRIGDAEAIFTNKVIIDRQLIESLPRLKYIGVMATGYNVVDLEAANKAGIVVTNIPAYGTDSVAQLIFSYILFFANRVDLHAGEVQKGTWSTQIDFTFTCSPQREIAGKTIGIVGFGKIGQQVAKIASAFGMKVLFQNRSPKIGMPVEFRQVELDELLRQSDFVSLNCPLTDSNRGFVNSEKLKLMKPDAILINTGRGPLINETDLAEALNRRQIGGAALDVLSVEPPHADNPLLTAANCIITPHIAWATIEARRRLMALLAENFKAFLSGEPQNVVNNPR